MVKAIYLDKEVRKNELIKYIELNGTVDGMTTGNPKLYQSIIHFDNSLFSLVTELGLNWNDVSNFTPTNFYKDFNNLKNKIQEFIHENNRFPSKIEIIKELGIQQRNIDYHGGIYEIKRKMNYLQADNYIDDNGFINRSLLEYKVAQFLIKNNIPYKREQYPFPKSEGYFRSDFMITTKNNLEFHVELWGFSNKDGNGMTKNYNKKKNYKLKLYDEYNINLISIEYDVIRYLNITKFQDYLVDKFSVLSDYEFNKVSNEFLVSPKSLTDEEILEEVMKYSENEKYLPTQNKLIENRLYHFISEIRKRHDSYLSFAKKFNKTLIARSIEWDEETVYHEMFKLIKKGFVLERPIFRQFNLGGLISFIKVSKRSIHYFKLNFYGKYINEIKTIPDREIKYLESVMNNRGSNIMNKVSPDQQEQAKQILEKYYSKTQPTPTI